MLNVVEEYWNRALGRDTTPGVHLVADSRGGHGVYVLGTPGCVRVTVPTDLLTDAVLAVHEIAPETLLTAEFWSEAFPDGAVLGPSQHHYLTGTDQLPDHSGIRRLNPGDHLALAELRSACPEADWEEGGFADEPGALFGAFDGGVLLAAANLTNWNGQPTDVGLLTRPEARRRGLATRTAAAASAHALRLHGIARLRALVANVPSMAIARRLGYTPYGLNVYVRL
ncbi:GNAT family N-acetyltransferase [Longispora fulva]|uniref:GNAT superfamily N-acetyltransferase n=1 Tax=Longispora fulva TaxID=619741 RepID=A0A8J7KLR2_9ACTN|nr:GNAT family N-acetyltransferase [Longispora fulva]MBG6138276.1 GNAT superfamily N-acetyltransferase [Longispora fulva]